MNRSGIYQIKSTSNPRRSYIGSAVDLKDRERCHLQKLRKNKHCNAKLQRHFNKYGEVDLQFIILVCCDKKDLIRHEQFFIDSLNPWFNICRIAGSSLGFKASLETRAKLSAIAKKRKPPMKGKHHSIETIMKLRGPKSKEWKAKLTGPNTEQWILHLRKPKSPEAKKNMIGPIGRTPWNKGLKGIIVPWNKGKKGVYSEETIAKMTESRNKRAPNSEETRRRMSEGQKRRQERERLLKQTA